MLCMPAPEIKGRHHLDREALKAALHPGPPPCPSIMFLRHWREAHARPTSSPTGFAPLPLYLCLPVMQVRCWKVLLVLLFAALDSSGGAMGLRLSWCLSVPADDGYCLSWRVAAEANNIRGWRTVPARCVRHVEGYMLGPQYGRDVGTVVDQVYQYLKGIALSDDGLDAWVLDVDDTCLSNLRYYEGKRFGGDPFDPVAFKMWAQMGLCPAIPAVLRVFTDLVAGGFKVFLVTGRDEETMGTATTQNLHDQGFVNYERLIMRGPAYKGKSAILFKSEVRKQLLSEGYRIWGNVGDQWSDLLGECVGDRTFKIPNPMYFVP